MPFVLQTNRLQARDSDSGAFFEALTISRENVYAFCLHWQGNHTILNALRKQAGSDEDYSGDPNQLGRWVIIVAGCLHPLYPNNRLISGRAEYREVIRLAVEALKVIPPSIIGKPPTTVDLAESVVRALDEFPLAQD